jgi:hypothetical protein
MDNSIVITLGIPKHGWLPIDFCYKDFHLHFEASDVAVDSIEELYNAVTELQNKEFKRITWYLEPAAYFFDIQKKGERINLSIFETDDLHHKMVEETLLLTITGTNKEIIEPFRVVLRQFSSQTYEEIHWPYNLDKDKIQRL